MKETLIKASREAYSEEKRQVEWEGKREETKNATQNIRRSPRIGRFGKRNPSIESKKGPPRLKTKAERTQLL